VCQFTSDAFTGVLKMHDIAISMDGRGRALDNIFVERLWRSVKHEDVYLKGYVNMPGLQLGLTDYFEFYNTERPHQSLGNLTPIQVYQTASGGGARIVDKFKERKAFLGVVPKSKAEATILNPKYYCLDLWVH
jgi:putative transposase